MKYPLVEKLGLIVMRSHWAGHVEGDAFQYAVSAEDLERILEQAPVVKGWDHRAGYLYEGQKTDIDPHWQGLIVCRQPIQKESEEKKLLREAANYLDRHYPLMSHPEDEKYRADIAYRAKALLGEEK